VWCLACNGKGYITNFINKSSICLLCRATGYLDEQDETTIKEEQ